jgi:hypothetical protein
VAASAKPGSVSVCACSHAERWHRETTVSVDERLNFLHEKPVDFLGKAVEHT